jgi:hypothetical protein
MADELTTLAFLIDWHAAELAAVEHMRALGFIDAQATAPGADGGIDAQSSEAAAQVKFYANPIGRPEIQRLRGAAHEYRLALFYSTGGYTSEAVAYANEAGVSLFFMDAYGRCRPASNFASLLVEPEHVEERRERLEELQAIRYRFAAVAFETDLTLYQQFALMFHLDAEEALLFEHVISGLEQQVDGFRAAVEAKSFADADTAFDEIQKRTALLSWITSPILKNHYVDIEDAISEGWRRDELVPDHLSQRAATGVTELSDFLGKAFDGWAQNAPDGLSLDDLVDSQTARRAGALLAVTSDPSILTPDLVRELKISVIGGVERARQQAKVGFEHIIKLLINAKLNDGARGMVAYMVRAERIASRVIRQLEASEP